MSCPPDKHHYNRQCPPQPRVQFIHRMDGNLQKLRCLFSHFFHRIGGTHDRNCAESLAPGAGPQTAKFKEKPLERCVSLSRARSSCRSNVSAESCDQSEMATSSSTASTNYNTRERKSDETYCSSVSAAGKDQELAMVMELHKLLDAEEEPFVLQDSIRDKIHPVRSKSSRGLMAMMDPAVLRDSRDEEDSLAEMIHGTRESIESVEDRHESAPCDASDLCTDQICKVEITDSESNDGNNNYGQLTQRIACDDGGETRAVDAIDGAGVEESGESTLIHENAPFHNEDGRNHHGIDRGPLDLSAKLDQSSILQQFSPVSVLDRVSLEEDEDEDEDRSSSRYGMNPLPPDCCFLPADNHTSSISEASKPIRSGSIVYDLELGCPYRPNNAAAPGHGGILHSIESFNDGSRNQALMASSVDLGEGNSNNITSSDEPPDHDQSHLTRQTMWLHVPEEIVQELGRPAITSFVSVIDTMLSPSLRGGSTRLQKHEAFGADDEYEAVREGLGLEVERSLFTVLLHDLLAELILQRQRQSMR